MKNKYVLFFLILICGIKVFSQTSNYIDNFYDDSNGLPQNSIRDITKDENGFIWLSTESGLVRFNGKQFKVFNNIEGSSSNRMDKFYKVDNQLIVRNIKHEYFEINNSKLSVAQIDDHLSFDYLPLNTEFRFISDFFHAPKDEYTYVYSNQNLDYFIRNDSVFLFQNKKLRVKNPILNFNIRYSFGVEGRFFAVDDHFRFYEFDLNINEFVPVFENVKRYDDFYIYGNSTFNQIFLCANKKVYKINFELDSNQINFVLVHDNIDVVEEFINSIFYDDELKVTYFGSWSSGLIQSKKNLFTVLKDGLNKSRNLHYSFDFIGDSIITENGLLFYKNQLIDKFPISNELKTFFVPNSKGDYFYTRFKSLFKKNINNLHSESEEVFTFKNHLYSLFIDDSDQIYISTRSFNSTDESKLFRLVNQNNHYHLDTLVSLNSDISFIYPKNEDIFWLGTEQGLYTFDTKTKTVNLIKGTENSYIRNISKFTYNWWISTYNNGFFYYHNGELIKIPIGNNSNLFTSHHIIEDNEGGVWISTNKGLYRTSLSGIINYVNTGVDNIIFNEFTVNDGLPTNEFNGGCYPCARKYSNGELVFPSLNGIVRFDPKEFNHYFTDHRFFIDKVKINDSLVNFQNNYNLPVGKHNVEFYFNTYEFNRNIEYSYQSSIDNNLVSKGKLYSSEAIWNGLSSGENKLQFGIIDADFENHEYAVTLNIDKYFYEKLWFKLMMTVIVLLIILTVFYFIQAKKDAVRKQIERIVVAQTSQIRENINSLKVTKNALENQLQKHKKIIGSITHDIKSPLIYLSYGIDFLKDELSKTDNINEDALENLIAIDNSVKKLQEYTENILSFSKASLIEGNTAEVPINLNALILNKIDLFKQMADIKRIDFTFEAKKEVNFKVNKSILSVILHNLIDNAIKNTSVGYVKVQLKIIGKTLIIKVKDSGVGMDEQKLLTYRNLLSGNTNQNISGSGLGLFIIAESIKIINAKISVESDKGKGTEVIITLQESKENDQN